MSQRKPHRIMFVCTGNTCRSPMAAALLNRLAREAGLPWTAYSAGVSATTNAPLSEGAAAELERRGVPPVTHKARKADLGALNQVDVVYTMTRGHRDWLVSLFPSAADKIQVLREAAGLSPADVEDPMGGGADDYERAADAVEEALKILVRRETHAQDPR